jgi:pseudouridine synthase
LLKGIPSDEDVAFFRKGMDIDGYMTAPAALTIKSSVGKDAEVEITIHEGRNRQIRKMCDKIGHPVISLKRIRIGEIYLGDLPEGKWRHLTEEEIERLK